MQRWDSSGICGLQKSGDELAYIYQSVGCSNNIFHLIISLFVFFPSVTHRQTVAKMIGTNQSGTADTSGYSYLADTLKWD